MANTRSANNAPTCNSSSPNSIRCDFTRLHRNATATPICNKRKLEQDTPKPKQPITPSNKKRRGRGRPGLPTPAQDDEQVDDGADDETTDESEDDMQPSSSTRYPLRSGGALPTPHASQQQGEGSQQQEAPPAFPSQPSSPEPADNVLGGLEPTPKQPAAEPDAADGNIEDDAEDNIMVARSRTTSPALPGPDDVINTIEGHAQHAQRNSEGRDASIADLGNPPNSPASTQMVPETPFLAAQRGLSISSGSPLSSLAPSIHSSQVQQDINLPDDLDHDMDQDSQPASSIVSSVSDILALDRESIVSNIHATHHPTSPRREARLLRRSRAAITRNLRHSTRLVNRLQARADLTTSELINTQVLLYGAQRELRAADRRSRRAGQRQRVRDAVMVGVGAVLGSVGWGLWGWMRGVEMEYVRRRRSEWFGL
ncbi:hypothetical protein TI39_contig429g00035 [Zymoseptoria brevis]|uniref:Uncharacterized protein n=1 Tax=Zymoseptoria brevis TaxID=1047168 RepID=A0A0F4GL72_9PEZI|nr:hypothetical protein TI39_contig429g00035 [Zymoseptoria brevis]